MLTKNTNLQKTDWQNKNIKNMFTKEKKAVTLSDKLEMIFGPVIFVLSVVVWAVVFIMFNQY